MATPFRKEQFVEDGMYVHYITDAGERKFVARFKYGGIERRMINFIAKNFTVEEYFGLLEDRTNLGPLAICNTKGYISNNQRRACKRAGYPANYTDFQRMIQDQIAARQAA